MKKPDNEVLVRCEKVGKKFCKSLKQSLWYGLQDTAGELIGRTKSAELRSNEFWAVQDVSFEVRRGECLGLIGHNGAGKSTLLKMLNGLIKPDTGRIEMHGRIGALIELSAGFNPILTGRENIYNKGAVLGFTKAEIDKTFDAIVEFAEIGGFLDTPVQNYSSGMKVRLGFAVSAQMQPDVLIIDEVLAVGDMGFVIKCLNRVSEIMQNCAVIFVSHSMPMITTISNHALVMDKGRDIYQGSNVALAVERYVQCFDQSPASSQGSGDAQLLRIGLRTSGSTDYNYDGSYTHTHGDDLDICIEFQLSSMLAGTLAPFLILFDQQLREVLSCDSPEHSIADHGQLMRFSLTIPRLLASQGKYSITVGARDKHGKFLCRETNSTSFYIRCSSASWATTTVITEWKSSPCNPK